MKDIKVNLSAPKVEDYDQSMADASGNRSNYFPAIEKKHGEKIQYWIHLLQDLETTKYPEQIAYLRENHGFSQAHANALVMYVRGSTSSKRVATPAEFFKGLDPDARKTAKLIFSTITEKYPDLELVVAWNQPMLRQDKAYIIGISVSKNHITINPFSSDVLELLAKKLIKYTVNKKTFTVPLDWKVDSPLLLALTKARIAELS
jgi:uncharacterized protein YdhG (YjbR/CyaY superfamily)